MKMEGNLRHVAGVENAAFEMDEVDLSENVASNRWQLYIRIDDLISGIAVIFIDIFNNQQSNYKVTPSYLRLT